MTPTDSLSGLKSLLMNRDNSFAVRDDFRTNPLSHKPGGVRVKVLYDDGSARIYDKIKNPEAYIDYMLNYSKDNVVDAFVIDDDAYFDWD